MYTKVLTTDIKDVVSISYNEDPSIEEFSRNAESGLQGRIDKEVDCLLTAGESFKFYKIMNEQNDMVGYFGVETDPVDCLTTFFIMPKYRESKEEIWSFIKSNLPTKFYAGLFKVNTRAIKFFEKRGGIIIGDVITENKPGVVFEFGGNTWL